LKVGSAKIFSISAGVSGTPEAGAPIGESGVGVTGSGSVPKTGSGLNPIGGAGLIGGKTGVGAGSPSETKLAGA
jgi:hypothetical protein